MSHNAFSTSGDAEGFLASYIYPTQQTLNLTQQLDAGVRGLMLDVDVDLATNTLRLRHGSADYGDLLSRVDSIVGWLRRNPSERVSVLIEENASGDVSALYRQILTQTGAFNFTIPSNDTRAMPPQPWASGRYGPNQPIIYDVNRPYLTGAPRPSDTLASLNQDNHRLFFYVDRNTVGSGNQQTHHAFPFVWHHFQESNFGNLDSVGRFGSQMPLLDRLPYFGGDWSFSERGQSASRGRESRHYRNQDVRSMALLNHFTTLPPSLEWPSDVNSEDRLVRSISEYSQVHQRPPRFVAIDNVLPNSPALGLVNDLNQNVWPLPNRALATQQWRTNRSSQIQAGAAVSLLVPGFILLLFFIAFGCLIYRRWNRSSSRSLGNRGGKRKKE